MFKFKNIFLSVKFRFYLNNILKDYIKRMIYKVYSRSTRFSITKFHLLKLENKYGHKPLGYQVSKLWTDLPKTIKDQNHLGRFQVQLKDNLFKDQLVT